MCILEDLILMLLRCPLFVDRALVREWRLLVDSVDSEYERGRRLTMDESEAVVETALGNSKLVITGMCVHVYRTLPI